MGQNRVGQGAAHEARDQCCSQYPACLGLQKRLEQESGARIVIRGRGSARDNRPGGLGSDPSDNEDLHVLVTADNDESLDKVRHDTTWPYSH